MSEKDTPELIKSIENLTKQEKVLSVRKQNTPSLYNKVIWLLFSFSLAITVWFAHSLNYYILIPWVLFLVVLMRKPYAAKAIDRKIQRVKDQKEECAKELQESAEERSKFIASIKKKKEKTATVIEISPICAVWDRLTGGYIHNRNGLICPFCHSHNGLCNPEERKWYICPNCERIVDPKATPKQE